MMMLSTFLCAVRWEDYARLLHAFLNGMGTGVDVDVRKHRIIGIGHSLGANAL